MKNELVHAIRGDVYTSSVIIAKQLEVTHKDLLRTVEKVIKRQNSNVHTSTLLYPPIFKESKFTTRLNRSFKMYELNEQAFIKVVMQLSKYEKAEVIQDMFIEAFFRMKHALQNKNNNSWIEKRDQTKLVRQDETDTIKNFVEYAIERGSSSAKRYYGNITKMTNKALELLVQSRDGKPLRDLATITELGFIQVVDHRAMLAIQDGMDRKLPYKEIYKYAKDEVEKLCDSLAFKKIEVNR